uniref:Uncharacterized protein n=1 Tax=Aegilops tauschii subsp. strangulata TaxID=200361 RepID=A0A453CZ93_AEGTS
MGKEQDTKTDGTKIDTLLYKEKSLLLLLNSVEDLPLGGDRGAAVERLPLGGHHHRLQPRVGHLEHVQRLHALLHPLRLPTKTESNHLSSPSHWAAPHSWLHQQTPHG